MKKPTRRRPIIRLTPIHRDSRGSIWDIVDAKFRHMTIVISKRGAVRGNHYHKRTTQHTYVVSGKALWYTQERRPKPGPIRVKRVEAGDLIITPPWQAHSMRALADTLMIELSDTSRAGNRFEAETVRVEPINDRRPASRQ